MTPEVTILAIKVGQGHHVINIGGNSVRIAHTVENQHTQKFNYFRLQLLWQVLRIQLQADIAHH